MLKTASKKTGPHLDQTALGKAFWSICQHYGFKRAEQALILGIKKNDQRLIDLEKKKMIPEGVDHFQRVGNLYGIHKNLRILYPYNRELVYSFMKRPFAALGEKLSPMDFLQADPADSFRRLFTIRRMLDLLRTGA